MNENHLAQAREDQVGRARQIVSMEAEAVSQCVCLPANDEFGLGILAANPAHQRRTGPINPLAGKFPVTGHAPSDLHD